MHPSSQVAGGEWRRHGLVVLPCIAGISLVSVHSYSLGVMVVPLEQEFGWPRAEITMGNLIISAISMVLAPFIGNVIDRLGPRPVALFGVAAYCVMLASLSTVTSNIWSWWWHWAALGLASSIILPTVWLAAINGLFFKHRGKALAIALLGTGLSAAFVPAFANALIQWRGWRGAYIAMAVTMATVVMALVLSFFYGASDRRKRQPELPVPRPTGLTVRDGFASPAFIKLAAGVFMFGITSLALTVNAVPVLMSVGFDGAGAAKIAGLIGIGSIAGRLGGGFLLDWFDAKKVAAVSVMVPIGTVSLLLFVPESSYAAGLALLMLGVSLGAEVDACSYLSARHFGMRSFGTLFGAINGVVVFGSGLAPVIANYVYDHLKTYDPVLWATIPLCLFAAVLFLSLGEYPDLDAAEEDGRLT